ncbi:MAG: LuxR C-terminal-related transcriptional regulator [Pseudomonadota bacterium]
MDTEVRVEAPNGTYRWVRSLGQPRRQVDGSTIWDGVALDVTDRREALEALERTLAEARRSEVAEGRFAYIAAQDLSGPLNALRHSVSSLQNADIKGNAAVENLVASLSTHFADFEKALSATKNLVSSGPDRSVNSQRNTEFKLTKRQTQILGLIREGASNQMIAETLGITEGTVKLHVSAILKALKVRNRTEAARI